MGPVPVVYDTNVLISAVGFGGTPLQALLRAFDEDFHIVASEATLAELERVMSYDRLPFTDADREEYLTILRREAELVRSTEDLTEIERDPADNMFLECAVAAEAAVIVSGDDHLLELEAFRGIEILTPRVFLGRYSS